MWMFVYFVINEFYLLFIYFCFHMCLRFSFHLIYIDIFFVGLVFGLKFLLIILCCIWQIKHLYFFGGKSKLQPMSSNSGNNKFLFGMLYINLLNLTGFIWFWSRIWGFYKFESFKSWGFWHLRLSRLILILHPKCFSFGFMWFFVFLIKVMIFGWLIICLDST